MAKTGSWQVQGSPWAHSGLEDRGGGACQEATAKSGFFLDDGRRLYTCRCRSVGRLVGWLVGLQKILNVKKICFIYPGGGMK